MIRLPAFEKIVFEMAEIGTDSISYHSHGKLPLTVRKVGQASMGSMADFCDLYSFAHEYKEDGEVMKSPEIIAAVTIGWDNLQNPAVMFHMVSLRDDRRDFFHAARSGENLEIVDKFEELMIEEFMKTFSYMTSEPIFG